MNVRGNRLVKYFLLFAPFVFFISLSLYFFFYSSPDRLVEFIGVNNAYLLIFLLAFIGGLTTFSGVPYYLVLIALSAGGLNPLLLGSSAAAGVMLGDSTSYYIGYRGGTLGPEKFRKIFKKIYARDTQHPKVLPLFAFFYGAVIPLSNDFITISAGIAEYPFWKIMVPLGLGNLAFNIFLAYFGTDVYKFFTTLFSF